MAQVMIPRAGTTATSGADVVFLFVPAFRSRTGWWLETTVPLGVVETGTGENAATVFATAAAATPNRRPLPADAFIVYGGWQEIALASVDAKQAKALLADPALLAEVCALIPWPTDDGGTAMLYFLHHQFLANPVVEDGPPPAPR